MTIIRVACCRGVRAFVPWLFCAAALLAALPASAWAVREPSQARAAAVVYLLSRQQGDGAFESRAGALPVQSTAAALLGLRRAGLSRSPQHALALAWLARHTPRSVDAQAHKVWALGAAGLEVSAAVETLLNARTASVSRRVGERVIYGKALLWGSYAGHAASTIDSAMALTALHTVLPQLDSAHNRQVSRALLCVLLPRQALDGSWPTQLSLADTPVHALTVAGTAFLATTKSVEALALNRSRLSAPDDLCPVDFNAVTDIAGALERATRWIAAHQHAEGGFAPDRTAQGGLNPPSVAATVLGARALMLVPGQDDALRRAQQFLLARQSVSGAWEDDALLTAQVLSVLPEASGQDAADRDADGLPDAVEALLGANTNVSARDHLPALGAAGSGTPLPEPLTHFSARVGVPFQAVLPCPGTLSQIAGALPEGLGLDPRSGTLTGTAHLPGVTHADYRCTRHTGEILLYTLALHVSPYDARLKVTSSANPAQRNQDVELSVVLEGFRPGGSVQLYVGDQPSGAAWQITASDTANTVTRSRSTRLAGGFHRVWAEYTGDLRNSAARSEGHIQAVNPDAAALLLQIIDTVLQ